MLVLICGWRDWTDKSAIIREIRAHGLDPERDTIIQGEARGADLLAKESAIELGWIETHNLFGYRARWDRYGKSAGHFRNVDMQQALVGAKNDGKDTLVLAFAPEAQLALKRSGTRDMIVLAKQAGIPVEVFHA